MKLRTLFRQDAVFGSLFLLLLTVPLLFSLYTYEKFEIVKLSLWVVWVGLALIAFFYRLLTKPQTVVLYAHVAVTAVLFFVWLLLSTAHSVDIRNSVFGFYPRFTNGFLFLSLWTVTLLLLGIGWNEEKRYLFFKLLSFDALVIAVVGIAQSLGLGFYEGINQPLIARAPGLLGNPNFTSMFLAGTVPLAMVLAFSSQNRRGRWLHGMTALLSIVCIAMLASRGAIIALLFGLVVFFFFVLRAHRKIKIYATLSLAVAALLCFLAGRAVRPQIIAPVRADHSLEQNITERLFVWDVARLSTWSHPLLGVGPGNFHIVFQQLRGKNLAFIAGVFDDPHNVFLSMAVSGGVPLALLFCMLFAFSLWTGGRDALMRGDIFSAAVVAGLSALLLAGCFTPVSTACYLLAAFFVFAGCSGSARPYAISALGRRAAVGIVFGALFFLYGLTFLAGEHLFFYGYNLFYTGNFERSAKVLSVARVLDPQNELIDLYSIADRARTENNRGRFFKAVRNHSLLHPLDGRLYVEAANELYDAFQVSGNPLYIRIAIGYMNDALTIDPLYAERYGMTALYYYMTGHITQAMAYVQYGLTLDPHQAPSWLLLARMYQMAHKKDQMVYSLQQAAGVYPESSLLSQLYETAKKATSTDSVIIPVGYLPTTIE